MKNQVPVIAIGGFLHETNTFALELTEYKHFECQDGWPALTRGNDIFSITKGLNIPISGFIDAAQKSSSSRLQPMFWACAEPNSFVTKNTYETLSAELCESIKAYKELDAVFLDLHGAMVTEHLQDGEGELLKRIREIVGKQMPVVISLDSHANITEAMIEHATAITIYRSYPHLDMATTGARAYKLLEAALSGQTIVGGMRKVPFLIPLSSQATDFEPCKSIYQNIIEAASRDSSILSIDFAVGFPPSDIFECGPSLVAYGTDQQSIDNLLDGLFQNILDSETLFENPLVSPDYAVQQAMLNTSGKPVVIADVQDNPGAGATSDTTGLLEALVRNKAKNAVIAILHDPEVADLAHEAGLGSEIEIELGAKSGFSGAVPYKGKFTVNELTDGRFTLTGAMYKDSEANLGPMALLHLSIADCDIQVIVGSLRFQCLDLAILRHLGVEPTEKKILVVKSTAHFRADFDKIAAETLLALAPGIHPCLLADVAYKNLRSGVRLGPMGPEYHSRTEHKQTS